MNGPDAIANNSWPTRQVDEAIEIDIDSWVDAKYREPEQTEFLIESE